MSRLRTMAFSIYKTATGFVPLREQQVDGKPVWHTFPIATLTL